MGPILFEGFEGQFFDFDFAAFTLNADVTGGDGTAGDLVRGLAVDEEANGVSCANNLVCPPFAGGIFIGRPDLRNEYGFVAGGVAIGADAGMQNEVALMLILALALDAFAPYGVGELNVNEYSGIVGMGGDFHKAPDDGKFVVVIGLFGAGIAVGLAGAMNHAVGHAPGVHGIGVIPHAKSPAVEIGAVEELNASAFGGICCFAAGKKYKGDYRNYGG